MSHALASLYRTVFVEAPYTLPLEADQDVATRSWFENEGTPPCSMTWVPCLLTGRVEWTAAIVTVCRCIAQHPDLVGCGPAHPLIKTHHCHCRLSNPSMAAARASGAGRLLTRLRCRSVALLAGTHVQRWAAGRHRLATR
jgi:hypothetical protein